MRSNKLVLLLLAVSVLIAFAMLGGVIAFGVARWGGAEIPSAIGTAAAAAGTVMLIGAALLMLVSLV